MTIYSQSSNQPNGEWSVYVGTIFGKVEMADIRATIMSLKKIVPLARMIFVDFSHSMVIFADVH